MSCPPVRRVGRTSQLSLGQPAETSTKALIGAAAAVGAEVFCIDSGWYKLEAFGDREENDELFGMGGFASVVGEIGKKGMLPGIWFEMEVVSPHCRTADKPDS